MSDRTFSRAASERATNEVRPARSIPTRMDIRNAEYLLEECRPDVIELVCDAAQGLARHIGSGWGKDSEGFLIATLELMRIGLLEAAAGAEERPRKQVPSGRQSGQTHG